MENKTLALFDFDGTITSKDSFLVFIRFSCGSLKFWIGLWLLSPVLILYKLGLIRNDKAKAVVFKYFFGNWTYEKFKKSGEDFCNEKLPSILKKSALEKIKFHLENNHRVILVTASAKEWTAPWCTTVGIEIISTEIEVKNNYVTGKLATANCYGEEKVNRIKSFLNLDEYSAIFVYGDSKGDREMLALSQNPHYKHFND